ncbi:hypothetical protein KEM52_005958 [Ascosphaera acerosa]|nr:hypothetical protein KEM52_005958 [Ascosphaera acerosa]
MQMPSLPPTAWRNGAPTVLRAGRARHDHQAWRAARAADAWIGHPYPHRHHSSAWRVFPHSRKESCPSRAKLSVFELKAMQQMIIESSQHHHHHHRHGHGASRSLGQASTSSAESLVPRTHSHSHTHSNSHHDAAAMPAHRPQSNGSATSSLADRSASESESESESELAASPCGMQRRGYGQAQQEQTSAACKLVIGPLAVFGTTQHRASRSAYAWAHLER